MTAPAPAKPPVNWTYLKTVAAVLGGIGEALTNILPSTHGTTETIITIVIAVLSSVGVYALPK